MVLNFHGDMVGPDTISLLKNCASILLLFLYAPASIQLNQHNYYFFRAIRGRIFPLPLSVGKTSISTVRSAVLNSLPVTAIRTPACF